MDALEERVLAPPRAQLAGGKLGVAVVAGQPPGAGQQGEGLVAGQLPDELDVAYGGFVPVRDMEAVGVVRGEAVGERVVEPVDGR